ncbi:SDR family oxidoreductase [uncultured Algimonas sp.]|uniref:SDR family oxidoreductase n=1 Tax=uncultured Algimonas sp. TaxID=1547920 RepID=UPI002632FA08|nr:SDR family oxidoreductase [uncultured Algimonas sp.]
MKRLNDKTAIITGAARGIGEGIARAFAAEGARVVLTDIDEEGGEALARELEAGFMRLDVSDEADWTALAAAYPQIDILVNNAGITGFEDGPVPHDPEHASLDDWRAVHGVNTDGTFLGCRYAIRAMRGKGTGAIVNISSRSGLVGIPAAAAYAASKAAIRNHTKTVALYCAQQGLDIRCNSVHPAAILTPMWEPMLGPEDQSDEAREAAMAALVRETPMQRFGTVEEVAALVVLLSSDEARYMTGAEMTIDGGLLAGSAATPE